MPEFDHRHYLAPPEIARRWGVSGEAVRRMIRAGTLPALRTPSGRYLVHRDHAALRSVAAR